MFDPAAADPTLSTSADRVLEDLVDRSGLPPEKLMLVGAVARDLIHSALGRPSVLRATDDLDLAVVVTDWEAYATLVEQLRPIGSTGIRYLVRGHLVDLMPFGTVEDPEGTIEPPRRGGAMSVWAFSEVFAASTGLLLPSVGEIRMPSIPGYLALKLGAWHDRSERGEFKDGTDLAAVMSWYQTSKTLEDDLYADGAELVIAENADPELAAVRALGCDLAEVLGADRLAELQLRWTPGSTDLLTRELQLSGDNSWTAAPARRAELLAALSRGWSAGPRSPAAKPGQE